MAVSKRLRFEILTRDGYTCRYCGAKSPDVALQVDHVVPVSLGGTDEPTNLVTACADCNRGKSSVKPGSELVDDVAADALRWARAMRDAAEAGERERADRDWLRSDFALAWDNWKHADGSTVRRDSDWAASVDRFIAGGLTPADLCDLVNEAMTATWADDTWRLFCSRAWKLLSTRQEQARRYLNDPWGQ